MGRKTSFKRTIELLKTAKDKLCNLGMLDEAKELGLFIEKINPKIMDLERESIEPDRINSDRELPEI